MNNKLAVICPCYNEEECLEISALKLKDVVDDLVNKKKIDKDSFIVFVDDGSKDNTFNIIQELSRDNAVFKYIKLSKNFGHQSALLCGLLETEADMYLSIDIDLQDDISKIEDMVDSHKNGNQIVYGVRKKREKDTFFKKYTAILYYKLLKLLGVNIIENHADFRLMSKKAVDKLKLFKEKNLFLRGIIPLIGLKAEKIYYDRLKREQGISKYTLIKMIRLALNGVFSFSISPLRLIAILGILFTLFSVIVFLYVLYVYIDQNFVKGWTSLIASVYLVGGLVLLSLSIIGEYIARIYNETKQRPLYIIEEIKETRD